MRTLSAFLFVALGTGVASANGFVINEHDAKATGRGNAVIATDTDPSSIVYNPGGLAIDDGLNIEVGATLIAAKGSYTDPQNVKTETTNDPAILPTLFVSNRINQFLAVGIGFHLPFGLEIKWPETSPQRSIILGQSLRTYFISPVVGVNLDSVVRGLSFGGGLDIVPATVELRRAIVFGDTEGSAHLGGDAVGIGGRVGVQYRPGVLPELSLGAMWRSSVSLDFEGNGDFDIAAPLRGQLPPDGTIKTSVTLPQSVGFGAAYRPIPELELELDGVWMQWSHTFPTSTVPGPDMGQHALVIDLPDGTKSVLAQKYKDTFTVRVGAEYRMLAKQLALRVGFDYDPTPISSATITAQLPDANRYVITTGGTLQLANNYGLSLGLLAVLPNHRNTDDAMYEPVFKGSYGVFAFVASLSLNGRFGAK